VLLLTHNMRCPCAITGRVRRHGNTSIWRRAEHEFRSALEIDPTFALARLLLGEVRVFQSQWSEAQWQIQAVQEQSGSLTEIDKPAHQWRCSRACIRQNVEERVQLEKLIGLQPHRVRMSMSWRSLIFTPRM